MTHRIPVSVIVLAKNEEQNIVRCLGSLHWAEELVVVDDRSTDRTAELARLHGARVVDHPFESFAQQRNWALREGGLRNDWVLMLDADEVSTPEFAAEIQRAIIDASNDTVAFRTCRKTMLGDAWLRRSDSFPVWIMRLVRRDRAWFADSGHGEVPVPEVDGEMGTIREPFVHHPFSRGLNDWWQRHIRYAEREARLEMLSATQLSWSDLIKSDASKRRRALRELARRMPCRGSLRFIYQYIVKRGFLDGRAGLQFCRMMGCYERMIVVKKWELSQER
ncbi:glycosyltransferase family 2 protein [Stieleria varia]|uniref:Glycosyl transferase family 2 n=1 Tax=Stieleria varia TaxID=2528005 RepID=A0A5C6B3A6_9BACT|nr:glycosyltransferase family 2 protein [Stieleria varia]TWU05941.1 Glycosyl transferase family 2 [Stieleria varia]